MTTDEEGNCEHGCDYKTGGTVVVLGEIGRNFAAGMSGGVAYLLDAATHRINTEMVDLEVLDDEDVTELLDVIRRHAEETGSGVATALLAEGDAIRSRFTKVMPRDYRRALEALRRAEAEGLDPAVAVMEAARG